MNRLDMSASDVLNFETLVKLRFLHQTKQAHTGIRKTAGQSAQTTETMTQRQSLARRFNAVIKEQQERGISTGSERGLGIPPLVEGMASLTASFLCNQQQVMLQMLKRSHPIKQKRYHLDLSIKLLTFRN